MLSRSLQKWNERKVRVNLTPQGKKVVRNLKNLKAQVELEVRNRKGNSVSQVNSVKRLEEQREASTAPNGKKVNRKFIRPIQKHQREYEIMKSAKKDQ